MYIIKVLGNINSMLPKIDKKIHKNIIVIIIIICTFDKNILIISYVEHILLFTI